MFCTLTIWHQLHWNMICKPMNNYRSAKKGCRKAAFVSDIWLEAVAIYSCYFNGYSSWCVVFVLFYAFLSSSKSMIYYSRASNLLLILDTGLTQISRKCIPLYYVVHILHRTPREEINTLQDILLIPITWSWKNKARNLAKFTPFLLALID